MTTTPSLAELDTPAALIDLPRMQRNIARMQSAWTRWACASART